MHWVQLRSVIRKVLPLRLIPPPSGLNLRFSTGEIWMEQKGVKTRKRKEEEECPSGEKESEREREIWKGRDEKTIVIRRRRRRRRSAEKKVWRRSDEETLEEGMRVKCRECRACDPDLPPPRYENPHHHRLLRRSSVSGKRWGKAARRTRSSTHTIRLFSLHTLLLSLTLTQRGLKNKKYIPEEEEKNRTKNDWESAWKALLAD